MEPSAIAIITGIIGLFTALVARKKIVENRNVFIVRNETYRKQRRKNSQIALALCFLGFLGLHRFYLKQPGYGLFYVLLSILTLSFLNVAMGTQKPDDIARFNLSFISLCLILFFDFIGFATVSREKFDKKYNQEM
jgi:TM2 domain-containing membrane protein YozV